MKTTIFNDYHHLLGARMVPFAGFEMPVEYSGVRQEHINVRENVGLFDVSHMGEFLVQGAGAYELVQRLTSNDVSRLVPGGIQYTCFPNHEGGIVDDLLVYCLEQQEYLLVVNAANITKDFNWIVEHRNGDVEIKDQSDQISQLAVQGPNALSLLQKLTPLNLSEIPYYHFVTGEMAGLNNVIISNSGYTGAGGFELYVDNLHGRQLWEVLFEAGRESGLMPAGLAARDTLRLEMGFCLYGNDIDDTTSPIEAGLGWIVKFTEQNHFINRAYLEKEKNEGPSRRLVGFELLDRGIPRQHYPILDPEGNVIGEVTSGTMSPMLNKGIGMGYVQAPFAVKGSRIHIGIRNKKVPAVVVRPPFYKPGD